MTFKFEEGEMVTVNDASSPYHDVQGQIIVQSDPYRVRLSNADRTVVELRAGQLNSRYASTDIGQKSRERDLLNYRITKLTADSQALTQEINSIDTRTDDLLAYVQSAADKGVTRAQVIAVVDSVYTTE